MTEHKSRDQGHEESSQELSRLLSKYFEDKPGDSGEALRKWFEASVVETGSERLWNEFLEEVQRIRNRRLASGEVSDEERSLFRAARKGGASDDLGESREGLSKGMRIGRFVLRDFLASGGMGQVWLAEDTDLEALRALKFVLPERLSQRSLAHFTREARAGGRLAHPNIVATVGYGKDDGRTWIAQEYVEGSCTLKDFLDAARAEDRVPKGYYRHVPELIAKLAGALQAAHDAGVIHRDVKPANVLITRDDEPKLTDFGLARIVDDAFVSMTGDFGGTYAYLSPEQVTAKRIGLDHRTDIFSLGVVLYELLSLRRPFDGDTSHQVMKQIVATEPVAPSKFRSQCPKDLSVICSKALEKDPDRRYQRVGDMADDLRRFLRGEPLQARAPSALYKARKWCGRNKWIVSAALLLITATSVFAILASKNKRLSRQHRQEAIHAARQQELAEELAEDLLLSNEALDFEVYTANVRAAAALIGTGSMLRGMQQLEGLNAEYAGWEVRRLTHRASQLSDRVRVDDVTHAGLGYVAVEDEFWLMDRLWNIQRYRVDEGVIRKVGSMPVSGFLDAERLGETVGSLVWARWSPGGRWIACECADGVAVINVESKRVWCERDQAPNQQIVRVSFCGDDKLVWHHGGMNDGGTPDTDASHAAAGGSRLEGVRLSTWERFQVPLEGALSGAIRVSPSGRYLAAGRDRIMRFGVWDLESGQRIGKSSWQFSEGVWVRDEKQNELLIASSRDLSAESGFAVLNPMEPLELKTADLGHVADRLSSSTGAPSTQIHDASGSSAVLGLANGSVALFRGQGPQSPRLLSSNLGRISLACISWDGASVVALSDTGDLGHWDSRIRTQQRLESGGASRLLWTAEGNGLVEQSTYGLGLRELPNGSHGLRPDSEGRWSSEGELNASKDWHSDNYVLAAAELDGGWCVITSGGWLVELGAELQELQRHRLSSEPILAAAITTDHSLAITCSEGRVEIFDLQSGVSQFVVGSGHDASSSIAGWPGNPKCATAWRSSQSPEALLLTHRGLYVVSPRGGGVRQVWELPEGASLDAVCRVAGLPRSDIAVFSFLDGARGTLCAVELARGDVLWRRRFQSRITSMSCNADGSRMALGIGEGPARLVLFDPLNNRVIYEESGFEHMIMDTAWSADGERFLLAHPGETIELLAAPR